MIPSEISLDVALGNVDRDPTSEEGSIVEGIPVFPAIVATALVLCTTASANGSNCNSSNPQENPPSSDGTLPFTGVDLTGVAAIAALLLGGGVALQRVSRGPR